MASKTPFNIYLSGELWDESTVAGLNRLGHKVTVLTDGPDDIYISRHAWRIPEGIAQHKVTDHIEMILKQKRLLTHENQNPGGKPEGTPESVPVPVKRKSRAKAKVIIPGAEPIKEAT